MYLLMWISKVHWLSWSASPEQLPERWKANPGSSSQCLIVCFWVVGYASSSRHSKLKSMGVGIKQIDLEIGCCFAIWLLTWQGYFKWRGRVAMLPEPHPCIWWVGPETKWPGYHQGDQTEGTRCRRLAGTLKPSVFVCACGSAGARIHFPCIIWLTETTLAVSLGEISLFRCKQSDETTIVGAAFRRQRPKLWIQVHFILEFVAWYYKIT